MCDEKHGYCTWGSIEHNLSVPVCAEENNWFTVHLGQKDRVQTMLSVDHLQLSFYSQFESYVVIRTQTLNHTQCS